MTQLLSPTETARRLGITYGGLAIWRCKKKKALPFVRIGRKIFYREQDIEKFITDNLHPGDGPKPRSRKEGQ